jgi:muramoyltetrapeptide carboxypeptidase
MVAIDVGMQSPAEGVLTRTLRLLSDTARPDRIECPTAQVWRSGVGEGPLIPANLSLLAAMVGTGRLPSLRGAILVLEEIDETPQRIDRMLTQLRLAGLLDGIVGLVVGQFTRCAPRDPGFPADLWRDVVRGHAAALDVLTLAGFPYGHEPVFEPLPVGVRARITSSPPALEILESAVAVGT